MPCRIIPRSVRGARRFAAALVLLCVAAAHAAAQPLGRTDPNTGLFPDSSLADFRFLLDKPAGKHGFLTVRNGRFAWPNGARARFWGVNIANRSVWVSRETIDKVVDVLARAGTNMVRFEAIDSTGALLDSADPNTSRVLDPAKLAILDYWTWKCRERGIYYYFDLLDFRTFKTGDEVPAFDQIGRAAKPYAFFDRRLIDLQKEFATQLLTHRNPHTGLRYVDDRALALVEICNEHGLFGKAASLDSLVEPYGSGFRQMWNRWLLEKYGSRDGIKRAWGQVNGAEVLGETESPNDFTIRLPNFTPAAAVDPAAAALVSDARRAPARLADGARFLHEIHRAFFREMREHLRAIGLKVPVTGVVTNTVAPDVASAALELDFTSENYYADHPSFAGQDWVSTALFNDTNPLRASSTYHLAPRLASLRWENKPVVVREYATVWPNRYRAVTIPEMAAYGALQDFDAVLLFGYRINPEPEVLSDFDHQADPPVWGLYALGALAFLRGDIAPSPFTATLGYTPDLLFRWPSGLTNLHRLSWFVRLNSTMVSPAAAARRGPARFASRGPAARLRGRDVLLWPGDGNALPQALDQLASVGAPVHGKLPDSGVFRGANGQVVRDTNAGRLWLETPRSVAVCGELAAGKPLAAGPFTLSTATPVGALMAVSLDGKPLSQSRQFIVKMVSVAENTGQEKELAPLNMPGRFTLKSAGKAPIRTLGRAEGTMVLRRNGQPLLSMNLTNGTWELLVRDGKATLACDTRGIRARLFDTVLTTAAEPAIVTAAFAAPPPSALKPAAKKPAPSPPVRRK